MQYTGNWKNTNYSPWLDLVAILTGKLISQRKQQIKIFAPISKLPLFHLTVYSDASLEGWGAGRQRSNDRNWRQMELHRK